MRPTMSKQDDIQERVAELQEKTALSEREAEVQAFRERGYERREIAEELDVKKSTVREYIKRIDDKRREATSTASILAGEETESVDEEGREPHVFLAPCSNQHAQGHFQDTVLNGVEVEKHTDDIPSKYHDQERLPIWGTGEGNASAAEAIEPGDLLAFYVGDKTYSHVAVVREVEVNEGLARKIWTDKEGETWPYVIYLEEPMEIELNSVDFHGDLGYDIAYPLGFTRVADEKVDQLRLQYGSVEEYFHEARARTAFEKGEELPIDMYLGFEEETEVVEEESLEELREAAEERGEEEVSSTTTSQTQYRRSRAVKEYARKRADGECEGCGDPAPFTSKTGDPYLEVHHVFEVSDEGPDKPDAVIALCPNCHRRVHYGEDGNEYNRKLIETLNEIEESLDLDTE